MRRAKARISSGCDSRPDNRSLHPVAIGAAVEVTKPSKPSRQRAASGGSASRQAATEVNAVQAPKQPDVGADPVALRGRPSSRETEGVTPHDATRCRGPTGVWAVACLHTEIRRNTGSPERRVAGTRPDAREGQAGPLGVAEGFVVPGKPDNAGGGKGPQFKAHGRRGREPGDWREPSNSIQRFRRLGSHDRPAAHQPTWVANGRALSESRMP